MLIKLTERELFGGLQLPLGVRESLDFDVTPRVSAESLRILFVTDGWSRVRHRGGSFDLETGSVLVIPKREWCRGEPRGYSRTVSLFLHVEFMALHLRWLSQSHPVVQHLLLEPLQGRNPVAVHLGREAMQMLRPKLALLAQLNGAPCSEFTILARVADVFDDIGLLLLREGIVASGYQEMKHVIPHFQVAAAARALYENPEHSWTVTELARRVALSTSQLTRLFRANLGIGPRAFLSRLRLDMMAELLATTENSVSEIARLSGWAAPSAASRAFKRRFGVPPSVFAHQVHNLGSPSTKLILTDRHAATTPPQ